MVAAGFIKEADLENDDLLTEAVTQFEESLGYSPFAGSVLFNTLDEENTENFLLGANVSSEDKRERMRNIISAQQDELSEEKANRLTGNYNEIYNYTEYYMMPESFDMTECDPYMRQARVENLGAFYDLILGPRKEEGYRKEIYKGNPKVNWQVLDSSFDDENKLKVQTQVKDEQSVALDFPDSTSNISASKGKRKAMFVDGTNTKGYVTFPDRKSVV